MEGNNSLPMARWGAGGRSLSLPKETEKLESSDSSVCIDQNTSSAVYTKQPEHLRFCLVAATKVTRMWSSLGPI